MKILRSQPVTVSASASPLLADYGLAALADDYPQHPFITDGDTVTFSFSQNGAQALFLGNAVAESVTVTVDSVEIYSETDRVDISDAELWLGRNRLADDVWVNLPDGGSAVQVTLTNSANRLEDLVTYSGNGETGGRILRSGGLAALYRDYPQIRLGTSLNGNRVVQLLGAGDGAADVVLATNNGSTFSLTTVRLPVSLGLLRIGAVETFANPQAGLSATSQDYGIFQEAAGSAVYLPRQVGRSFDGNLQLTETEKTRLRALALGLRQQPFAVQVLPDLDNHTTLWARFQTQPTFNASSPIYNLFDTSFSFIEQL
jgi:hypothetical protein